MNFFQDQAASTGEDCAICGESAARITIKTQEFGYLHNGETVTLSAQVPVWSCAKCGEEYLALGAEEAQHEAVCAFLGRLSPSDIRSLRMELGLTQAQLAERTGIGIASIKRWEAGTVIQSAGNDKQLRTLRSTPSVRQFPKPKFRTEISQEAYEMAEMFKLRPVLCKAA